MHREDLRELNDIMILGVLSRGDADGLALSGRISETSGGVCGIRAVTLYAALNRMETRGLIQGPGTDCAGGPRTCYSLTEDGRRYFRDLCGTWKQAVAVLKHFGGDCDG